MSPARRGRGVPSARSRMVAGGRWRPAPGLFTRYGDTVYLQVRPWEGLYIFSRLE